MKTSSSQSNHQARGARSKRPRNKDGSFRRRDRPRQDTQRSIIANWVEQEVVARRGFSNQSFARIAAMVVEVAYGREPPRVPLPAGLKFPANYTLGGRGAMVAFARYRAREDPNWAGKEKSTSNLEYELGRSSRAQMRRLDTEPLRLVRLQLRQRLRYRGLGGYLDLGTLDLGGLNLKGFEALQLLLWHITGTEIETARTKTTLHPDIIYTADPEFEEIRKALTPRELQQVERIWERGRRRASARSQKREHKKSKAESLNPRSEAPTKADPSGSSDTQKPAAPLRSEELSHAENDQAAAYPPLNSQDDAPPSTREAQSHFKPIPDEEFHLLRNKLVPHFAEKRGEPFSAADLARMLNVDLETVRSVMNDLRQEGIVEELNPDLWWFKNPNRT